MWYLQKAIFRTHTCAHTLSKTNSGTKCLQPLQIYLLSAAWRKKELFIKIIWKKDCIGRKGWRSSSKNMTICILREYQKDPNSLHCCSWIRPANFYLISKNTTALPARSHRKLFKSSTLFPKIASQRFLESTQQDMKATALCSSNSLLKPSRPVVITICGNKFHTNYALNGEVHQLKCEIHITYTCKTP